MKISQKIIQIINNAAEDGHVNPQIVEILFGIPDQQPGDLYFNKIQIDRLVEQVSVRNLQIISYGFLAMDYEVIENLKWEHNDDTMMFKREILRHWLTKNPGKNSKYVGLFSKFGLE